MSFLNLIDINLAFGDREIIKNVNLSLSNKSRAGLAGVNGSGKSTLMKIIAGLVKPDSGEVSKSSDTIISYLPQSGIVHKGHSILEETEKAFTALHEKKHRKEKIEHDLQNLDPGSASTMRLLEEQHELEELLLHSGYYERDKEKEIILKGLGFRREDLNRDCGEFSGGWQMRIALSKILLSKPTIMLLDEPTNYLDLEARSWLLEFLKTFPGGMLLVSHDRYFLDETINEVCEMFNGKLTKYKGNYSKYEDVRIQEIETLMQQYKKQQDEIDKNQQFIDRFRYTATKASAVQSRVKQLEKIEAIEIPENLKKMHFQFPQAPESGEIVMTLDGICKSYGPRKILNEINLMINRGEKIAFTGVNGAGKSTLLRIIAGFDPDYSGNRKVGANVTIGYFAQDHEEKLNQSNTVEEEAQSICPTSLIPKIRSMLGSFLFRGDDVFKSISVLSGGEKNRLSLLKMLMHPSNLLILDEPTNHLDLNSKDILLEALQNFKGTVLFVSHDRYFLEKLATRIVEIRDNGVYIYHGDFQYYLWKKNNPEISDKNTASSIEPIKDNAGKLSFEQQKEIKNRLRKLEKEEQQLMEQIGIAEDTHKKLLSTMEHPDVYSNPVKAKETAKLIETKTQEINRLTETWEKLSEEFASLQQISQ